VKRLLVVSNGYGEDMEVAQVIRCLPADGITVSAYPLVGLGRAYPRGVSLLEPRREFPSGGFGMRAGLSVLWADLRGGWLAFWAAQRSTLRSQRGRVDLVVAAGDVYCLWMAAHAGGPTVYLALPRSEYIAPHSPLELRIIRRAASRVFTRDEATAEALRRRGLPAEYVGFILMDTMTPSGETFGIPPERPVLTLLPGSKPPAFENLVLLLRAVRLVPAACGAAGRGVTSPAVLVAWAPGLPGDRLRQAVEATGARWVDEHRFHLPDDATREAPQQRLAGTSATGGHATTASSIEVIVTTDHFADALARATVVLGMAGAAHEQAAGLGKPVVAFPGTGPQFTGRFLREQQRLLGEALVVAASPEQAADAVARLLADPEERARRGRVGRERQGRPGGAAAIAEYLAARLGGPARRDVTA
jgi:uncharacterized protein (TIGR03492 family)